MIVHLKIYKTTVLSEVSDLANNFVKAHNVIKTPNTNSQNNFKGGTNQNSFDKKFVDTQMVTKPNFSNVGRQRSYEEGDRPQIKCFLCNTIGHRMWDCRKRNVVNNPPVQNKNSNFNSGMNAASRGGQATFSGGKSELQCSFCMRKGHTVDSCFKKLNSIAAVTCVGEIREVGVESNQKFSPPFNKRGTQNNCRSQFKNKAKQSDFIRSDTELLIQTLILDY